MWSPSFPFALFRLAYVWAGACTALHGCLHTALKPQRLPRLSALSRKELGVLVNTLVAGCHAGVMFWGTARYMLSRFEPTWRVFTITQVSPNSPTENRYCDLMLGYLLYDCAVGVLAGGNGADILAHHLAGLASWACLRLYDTGGIYMMWVHLAEVRTHASTTANAALTLCTLLWLVGIHALPARHHGAVQAGLGQHGGVPRVRALHAAEFHACAGPLSALVSAVHVAHPGAVGRAPLSVCDHDGHQQRVHSPQYPLVDQAAEESTGPQGRAQEVTRTRAGGCGQGQGRMSDKCPPRCVGLWSYAPRLLQVLLPVDGVVPPKITTGALAWTVSESPATLRCARLQCEQAKALAGLFHPLDGGLWLWCASPFVCASARAALRVSLLGGVRARSDAAAFERLQRRAAQTRAGHVLRLRPAQPSDRVRVFLPCAGGGGSFGAPAAASNLFGAKPAGSPFGTAQARARPLSVHRALFQRAPSPRAV